MSYAVLRQLLFFDFDQIDTRLHDLSRSCISDTFLTHCVWNRLSHTIYWKSPISILGTPGYEIYIFLEKNG